MRRRHWRRCGLVGLGALTVIPWALTVSWLLFAAGEYGLLGETPTWLSYVVWLVLVLAPVGILGTLRREGWGWWAAGLPAGALLVGASILTTHLVGLETAPGHAERQLTAFQTASAPGHIYYLGRKFHGWDLDDVTMFPAGKDTGSETDKTLDPGDRLDIGYGTTCETSGEGVCGAQLDLEETVAPDRLQLPGRCRDHLPPLPGGAEAVETSDGVTYFIGPVALRVANITWDGLGRQVAASLRGLRQPAGQPLPAPPANTRRMVAEYCHESP